jgi:hypothetical protein
MTSLSTLPTESARRDASIGKLAAMIPTLPNQIAATAPESMNVPYVFGMDYGVGVDTPSGSARNVAVTGIESKINMASGDSLAYYISQIENQTELQTALEVSAEASANFGLFSGSARMNFAKNTKINTSSVFVSD